VSDWKVFEFETTATAVVEARFQVVARTEEEAIARFRRRESFDDYHLASSVENWIYIASEFGEPCEVTESPDAANALEYANYEEIEEEIEDLFFDEEEAS
jgi:hypothetical protein